MINPTIRKGYLEAYHGNFRHEYGLALVLKALAVDTEHGKVLADHFRILTPHPATPEAVSDCVAQVAKHFDWKGRIGCTFPGVVKKGVTMTAANMDEAWIGADATVHVEQYTQCKTTVINDAMRRVWLKCSSGRGAAIWDS